MVCLCPTLEYGVGSWGSKVVSQSKGGGAIVASLCTLVVLLGVRVSKLTTNVKSSMKATLVVFMIVAGMVLSLGSFPGTKALFFY